MKFHSNDYVYKTVPPVLGNEDEKEPVIIGLKGVSTPDLDKIKLEQHEIALDHSKAKAAELITQTTIDFVKSKFVSCENLEIDGQQITTFDDFYSKAPQEFVQWVMLAIYSTQILSESELKNS